MSRWTLGLDPWSVCLQLSPRGLSQTDRRCLREVCKYHLNLSWADSQLDCCRDVPVACESGVTQRVIIRCLAAEQSAEPAQDFGDVQRLPQSSSD